jgi:hypothetical protein
MINFQKIYPTFHNTLEKTHSMLDLCVDTPQILHRNTPKIAKIGLADKNYTFHSFFSKI